jgi:hypothetical protein
LDNGNFIHTLKVDIEQVRATGWMVWGSNPGGGEILLISNLAHRPNQSNVQWVKRLALTISF